MDIDGQAVTALSTPARTPTAARAVSSPTPPAGTSVHTAAGSRCAT